MADSASFLPTAHGSGREPVSHSAKPASHPPSPRWGATPWNGGPAVWGHGGAGREGRQGQTAVILCRRASGGNQSRVRHQTTRGTCLGQASGERSGAATGRLSAWPAGGPIWVPTMGCFQGQLDCMLAGPPPGTRTRKQQKTQQPSNDFPGRAGHWHFSGGNSK